MEMWMIGFLVGLVTALLVLTAVYVLSKNKEKLLQNKASYDERQRKARGDAYKAGFITALVCMAGLLIAEFFSIEKGGFDLVIPLSVAASVSLAVFGCVCVWKDAWLSLKDSPQKTILSTSFVVILNLAVSINGFLSINNLFGQNIRIIDAVNMQNFINGLPYESLPYEPRALQLYMPFINMLCAVTIFIVLINYLIKLAVDKSREKREVNEES